MNTPMLDGIIKRASDEALLAAAAVTPSLLAPMIIRSQKGKDWSLAKSMALGGGILGTLGAITGASMGGLTSRGRAALAYGLAGAGLGGGLGAVGHGLGSMETKNQKLIDEYIRRENANRSR